MLRRLALYGVASLGTLFAQYRLTYTVSIPDPNRRAIYVRMDVSDYHESKTELQIPAWAPGSYFTLNFGRWIDSVQAFDASNKLIRTTRKNINTWTIESKNNLAHITYIARDIPEDSVESLPTSLNEMTSRYYFFNGPSVFAYIPSLKKDSCRVTYDIPCGWRVFCSLDALDNGTFKAKSYDELADSPVVMGNSQIDVRRYEQGGASYFMVSNSEKPVALDTILSITKPLTAYYTRFFGQTPFKQYYFLFNFFTQGTRFGALEHAGSSAYYLPPPTDDRAIRNSFYSRVIAHEFFHLWNPKRLHPAELHELNYQLSPKFSSMWFVEGLTEYYAKLGLVRSGVLPRTYFYDELKQLTQIDLKGDLEALSYKSSESGVAPEMYVKGALMTFLMDMEIREKSNSKSSLDSVVIYLNRNFALRGKPYEAKKLLSLIKTATQVDVKPFYEKYIVGANAPPYRDYLEKIGLTYEVEYDAYHGWLLDINDNNELFVSSVSANSTASGLGLKSDDIILEIQNSIVPKDIDSIRSVIANMESLKAGESLQIKVMRSGKMIALKSPVIRGGAGRVKIQENPNATEKQKRMRESLFQ